MNKAKDTSRFLRKHRIRPSIQRVAILDYLLRERTHPSAEQIYQDLSPQMATLSRTTVYNTLTMFKENGVIHSLDIDPNASRFDAIIEEHVHFFCTECREIIDLPFPKFLDDSDPIFDTLEIQERYISYKGLCPKCKSKS